MKFVLIGAGGHSRALVETIYANGGSVAAYVDRRPAEWLDAPQIAEDDPKNVPAGSIVIGVGAVNPDGLHCRLALMDRYLEAGRELPPLLHPKAIVSPNATVEAGAIVLAGAIVQPAVHLCRGVIVNCGSIVSHDSKISAGSHLAPGAVVLGGCQIGELVMVGAGAVVLVGASVPNGTLVRAGERYS